LPNERKSARFGHSRGITDNRANLARCGAGEERAEVVHDHAPSDSFERPYERSAAGRSLDRDQPKAIAPIWHFLARGVLKRDEFEQTGVQLEPPDARFDTVTPRNVYTLHKECNPFGAGR